MQSTRLIRRRPQANQPDLCSAFCSLYIAARGFSISHFHHATGGSNNATPNPVHSSPPGTTKRARPAKTIKATQISSPKNPAYVGLTAADRAAAAKLRADEFVALQNEKARQGPVQGGLAKGNIFSDEQIGGRNLSAAEDEDSGVIREDLDLAKRSPSNMEQRLDPKPNARARWTRTMVIRDIRRRGRLTKVMRTARTERSHLSKSRFLKTSIKKLAPLARQIAGKSLDEAILQMRFSSKKAAQDVRQHLIQARNEAVVQAGMGLPDPDTIENLDGENSEAPKTGLSPRPVLEGQDRVSALRKLLSKIGKGKLSSVSVEKMTELGLMTTTQSATAPSSYEVVDPSNTPALSLQTHSKALKSGLTPNPTDLYIAEAWVNRGMYQNEPSPRARGRTDILRHPYTGISVLLKEEKTRTREKQDKEIKAIRKRLNGKLWTQMPDRPIVRQSQYVLW